jgi:hypothetical protein
MDWEKLLQDLGISQAEPKPAPWARLKSLHPITEAEYNKKFGRPPDPTKLDAISANDRAWFEANPGREIRVRSPMAGEDDIIRGSKYPLIIVTHLARGLRSRQPIDLRMLPPEGLETKYVDATGFIWSVTREGVERTDEQIRDHDIPKTGYVVGGIFK